MMMMMMMEVSESMMENILYLVTSDQQTMYMRVLLNNRLS